MFPLHDRVRRRLCLAGFFLLCVLPTLAVLGWAAAWSSPWHVRSEARWIGRHLGMDIRLGRVEHLRPGAVRLHDVLLRDCEEPDVVLRCDQLDAEQKTVCDTTGKRRRVLTLLVPAVEIDAERLPALGKLARRLLELRAGNLDVDLRCLARTVDLRCAGPAARFHDVRGVVQTVESGTEAWAKFHIPGQRTARPAFIQLGRNRQVQPTADYFALDTGGAELPCELLGRAIPAMRSLGPDARFRGYLFAQSTPEGWNGKIVPIDEGEPACELLDVDLDRLVTDRFPPHTLSGKARVVLASASFCGGRLERAVGGVSAGPGDVSPSLLRAAAEHLGLEWPPAPSPQPGPVHFDGLALRFEYDDRGLVLRPGWSNCNAVMVAGQTVLLAPTGHVCPSVGLIRALAPAESIQIPATRQTEWLLRHLALPESGTPGATQGHPRIAIDPSQEAPAQ